MNRGDFWGWGQYAPTEGRVIENQGVKAVELGAERAVVEVTNAWKIQSETLMQEVTTVTVSEDRGAYIVDLDYGLTPVVDLVLNHTAFGGFCVRARNDGDSHYATPDGKVTLPDPHYSVPELNWPAAEWYDYTIKLDGGKTVGCAPMQNNFRDGRLRYASRPGSFGPPPESQPSFNVKHYGWNTRYAQGLSGS